MEKGLNRIICFFLLLFFFLLCTRCFVSLKGPLAAMIRYVVTLGLPNCLRDEAGQKTCCSPLDENASQRDSRPSNQDLSTSITHLSSSHPSFSGTLIRGLQMSKRNLESVKAKREEGEEQKSDAQLTTSQTRRHNVWEDDGVVNVEISRWGVAVGWHLFRIREGEVKKRKELGERRDASEGGRERRTPSPSSTWT